MSSLVIETPAAAEPIDISTVKNHLRVTISDDDALIGIYLQAAREDVESEIGRSLVAKVYRQSHDRFPRLHEWSDYGTGYFYSAPRYAHRHGDHRQAIKLLRCPLLNVVRVSYIGTDELSHDLLPAPELWQKKTEYAVGDQVSDGTYLQQVTAAAGSQTGGASVSGSSTPSWNATLGATTTDGDLTWTNQGVVPAGDFLVDRESEPPRLLPLWGEIWPSTLRVPNAVQVYFTAGYGADDKNVPALAKVAILRTVGSFYENRESATPENLKELPDNVQRMLWSLRVTDYDPTH